MSGWGLVTGVVVGDIVMFGVMFGIGYAVCALRHVGLELRDLEDQINENEQRLAELKSR